jgi:hypothetical protein
MPLSKLVEPNRLSFVDISIITTSALSMSRSFLETFSCITLPLTLCIGSCLFSGSFCRAIIGSFFWVFFIRKVVWIQMVAYCLSFGFLFDWLFRFFYFISDSIRVLTIFESLSSFITVAMQSKCLQYHQKFRHTFGFDST